ncbi:P-loop containing nucleoside triphosphate hydrolase protein [Lophiotrema nucula]|uniref:Structural maintenance of chromosomes protein 5 n=1 Tax=Lophiotrema nucula TaxID=690887 RepID=A0A6A5ZCR0_9PLEO|nr:P-loop containing nucleoside triphosphate hydrolase protein [Lophiotrema nucula]
MVGRRKRTEDLSDEEEQSDARSSVSGGSKRARYERDASVQTSASSVRPNGHRTPRRTQNGRNASVEGTDQDAHQPGSIVRVKLKNFVTYTEAEFNLGPSLNMIIGPNGTGKSTLVCAICLGLGWETKNLGRAKEIGEFVKHGNTEATIEIELAAGPGHESNPIIRRVIRKEGNKSMFFLDGRQATQKAVVALAKSFSIQIDNLCQFLPQDRVVEFAQLSPVDLLTHTQRAAAPEQMVVWHEQLKDLRKKEKALEVSQTNESEHLKGLQQRQSATREDVDRWHQRQELITKVGLLEKCKPALEVRLLKAQIDRLKEEKKKAQDDVNRLNAEAAPARQALDSAESYQSEVDGVQKARKAHSEAAKVHADTIARNVKREQEAITEFSAQVDAEKAEEKKRRQDVKRLEGVIAQLERAISQAPVDFDAEDYQNQLRELRSRESAIERSQADLRDNQKAIADQGKELRADLQRKVNEREDLNTQSGQQASLLARVAPETAKAWDWIQKNQGQLDLKGEVHGPPLLTCSITDPRYADAVETSIGGLGDMTAITCTNPDDQMTLSDKIFGETLKLHNVMIRCVPQSLAAYRSPVTQTELQQYGLQCWMIELLQGPEPVLAMLCDSKQLHRTGYAPRELSAEQFEPLKNSPISSWIAGRDQYRITRRQEYGGHESTAVRQVKKAQLFTDQPVDAGEKRRLDEEIDEMKQNMRELQDQHKTGKADLEQLRRDIVEIREQKGAVELDLNAKKKARNEWELLPNKKAMKQEELDTIRASMAETTQRILAIKTKSEKAALEIASLILDYIRAVTGLRQAHESLLEADIRLVEANSEVDTVKAEQDGILRAIEASMANLEDIKKRNKAAVRDYNARVVNFNDEMDKLTEEERELIDEYAQIESLNELQTQIEMVEAKLQMMAGGDPNAVRAYEKRKAEIERVQQKLEEIAAALSATAEEIAEIRTQWEPQLDEMVSKISDGFSHNFQRIGCAGQVAVYKDEDFEKWSIQIQVRFRENESMSILDSHRQSGGERAVSTVFYLMALQDLARSPFRVVDEINQGMDPRNERMVHERMVAIACQERTSQYFLITPKLLNDLVYDPKMMVHCIASGEHMPAANEGGKGLDFSKLALRALQVNKGGIVGVGA